MMTFLEYRLLLEEVPPAQLTKVEQYVDVIAKKLGLGFEFSRHFGDQINNSRNKPGINAMEIVNLFQKVFAQHGKEIRNMKPEDEALMRDLSSDLNLPIAMKWDRATKRLYLKGLTIMRKKGFGNDNFNDQKFVVN